MLRFPLMEIWQQDSPDFYHFWSQASDFYPLHLHRYFELTILWEGRINLQVGQNTYAMQPGDAVLIFPQQLHATEIVEKSRFVAGIFAPELIPLFTSAKEKLIPESNLLKLQNSPWLQLLWTEFDNIMKEKSDPYRVRAVLYLLASEAERQLTFVKNEEQTESGSRLLMQMLTYIQQHWQEDCSLKKLSAALGYDYAYLSRFFLRMAGMQYTAYVNRVRVMNACCLMQNSDTRVIEIAEQCGFNSLRSFYRNFYSVLHCTTTEYLERCTDPANSPETFFRILKENGESDSDTLFFSPPGSRHVPKKER